MLFRPHTFVQETTPMLILVCIGSTGHEDHEELAAEPSVRA
jgi:hypothetical protein